jgi:hypothetical protein
MVQMVNLSGFMWCKPAQARTVDVRNIWEEQPLLPIEMALRVITTQTGHFTANWQLPQGIATSYIFLLALALICNAQVSESQQLGCEVQKCGTLKKPTLAWVCFLSVNKFIFNGRPASNS